MAVVVFFLFAIGMASAAGYQLVRLEGDLATQGRDSDEALSVAAAGLQRYVGEQLGVPADSVTYVIGGGTALIRSRKLVEVDSVTDVYLIRSTGTVVDARFSDSKAVRTVSQQALLHKDPIGIHAALMVAAGRVEARNGAEVSGYDHATSSDCSVGGLYDVTGVVNTGSTRTRGGSVIEGAPDSERFGGFNAIYDSAKVRWDVLESSSFAVKHDGSPPRWSTIPSDSFPVVRATDNLRGNYSWSGQGVLIVPGRFSVSWLFYWKGVILAGSLGDLSSWGLARIEGIVIAGLDGAQGRVRLNRNVDILYNSCYAMDAAASIAYLEPLANTWLAGY
jgi:hypothetical protein